MIKPELKDMMLQDIKKCSDAIKNPTTTNALYYELVAKYEMIDKDFQRGMPNFVKTLDSNYLSEIKVIKTKLETYIALDEIPINYNYNVAKNANVTINVKKFQNKGNIGTGNNQPKSNTLNLSVGESNKCGFWSWLKRIFGRV